MKRCLVCEQEKPLEDFSKAPNGSQGRASYCKICDRQRAREWYQANKERSNATKREWARRNAEKERARHAEYARRTRETRREANSLATKRYRYKVKYGITLEDYEAMLASQGGVCAICKGPPKGRGSYHVDHCHTTGRVRGLLCSECNTVLGKMKDDPALLRTAAAYLERLWDDEHAAQAA